MIEKQTPVMPVDSVEGQAPTERLILHSGEQLIVGPDRPIEVDAETGTPIVARIELPGDTSLDMPHPEGAIRVAYTEDGGYVLAGPGAKLGNDQQAAAENTIGGFLPFRIGNGIGDHVEMGRKGILAMRAGEQGEAMYPDIFHMYGLSGLNNMAVSRRHLTLDTTVNGLVITDNSSNGTAVETATR